MDGQSLYDRLADISLDFEDWDTTRLERDTPSGFVRVSTEIHLHGAGETGTGEDVTFEATEHDHVGDVSLPARGTYTLSSFAEALDETTLFPNPSEGDGSRHYRRWGLESAALDLALRQAGRSLGEVVDRTYDPVTFVVSTRLGDSEASEPPSIDRLERLLADHPDLGFKLDPTSDWDEDFIGRVADLAPVRVADCKALYDDPDLSPDPDADLYRRLLEGFPDAIIEDPALTPETRPVFEGHSDRLSWDAPITSVESVKNLALAPSWLNCKPSRFGTVESLCTFLDYAEDRGIRLYGGGQFELGVGRAQIQALASLFYPDGPNDVAPGGYNEPEPAPALPDSPLSVVGDAPGFGQLTE